MMRDLAAFRHEALRTRFPSRQGRPAQEILPAAELAVPADRVTGLDHDLPRLLAKPRHLVTEAHVGQSPGPHQVEQDGLGAILGQNEHPGRRRQPGLGGGEIERGLRLGLADPPDGDGRGIPVSGPAPRKLRKP